MHEKYAIVHDVMRLNNAGRVYTHEGAFSLPLRVPEGYFPEPIRIYKYKVYGTYLIYVECILYLLK